MMRARTTMAAMVPPTIAPTGAPDFSFVVAEPGFVPRSPVLPVGLGEPELDEPLGVEPGLEEELDGLDVELEPVPVPVLEELDPGFVVLPPPLPVVVVEPPTWTSITNLSSVI